jgi:hypothetical protein
MQMERRAFLTALLGGVLAATTAGAAAIEERPAAAVPSALDTLEAEFTQGPPQPRAPDAAPLPTRPHNPRPRRKNWHRYRQRNRRPLPPRSRHRRR